MNENKLALVVGMARSGVAAALLLAERDMLCAWPIKREKNSWPRPWSP